MKITVKILALFLVLLGINACKQYTNEFNTVEKTSFTINLPDYMDECKDMVPEGNAPVQYCNRFRNLYLVVFEDENTGNFAQYQKQAANVIKINSGMTDVLVTDSVVGTQNNTPFTQLKIYGLMGKDNDMFYTQRVYQGASKYYQVCIWTRGKKRKLAYQQDVDKIMASFAVK